MTLETSHWRRCTDDDCRLCADRREAYERQALPHLVDRLTEGCDG